MNKETLQRVGIWAGVLAVLGLMVWGLASLGASQDNVAADGTIQDPVSAEDHTKGGTLATNTLVEYSDFQCPACGAYFPIVKKLGDTYGGRLQIVYRYYPLTALHLNAQMSAQAAEAAGVQGKFWEYHDLLFTKQSEWNQLSDPKNTFADYANTLGLNKEKFLTDIVSSGVIKRVQRDLDSGNRANVNATPTFYLNGKKLTNLQTYADLENDIKNVLK